ncbi:MAG: hypothetical protein J5I90_02695 [Caldilineales bacterium]|nr:hypothetical protein [Caldilineales bacterium]
MTLVDIMQWNVASDGWHTSAATMHLRVGGVFSSLMKGKDGSGGYDDLPWRSITYVFFYARPVGGTLAGGDDADLAQFYPPDQLPPNIAFTSNQAALAHWQANRAAGLPAALGR